MGDTVCAKRGTEQKLKACDRHWFTNDTTVQISTFLVNVVPSFHYTLKMIYYKLISAESLYRDFIVDIVLRIFIVLRGTKSKGSGSVQTMSNKGMLLCSYNLYLYFFLVYYYSTTTIQKKEGLKHLQNQNGTCIKI